MIYSASYTSTTAAELKSTTPPEVNSTFLRRLLIRVALKTTAKFLKAEPSCIRISKHKVVKTGPHVDLVEAQAMRFIAQNTSLPVPDVWCAFVHKKCTYIVMERIRGQELPKAWNRLSTESRESVFRQLKGMIQEMRSLRPPCDSVMNCVGGSLRDSRIPKGYPRFGPFQDIHSFHQWLRNDLTLEDCRESTSLEDGNDIRDMIVRQDGPWASPVFTHGDLNPFNILVREDRVVGILDWEFSGWYPCYWEYTAAWFGNRLAREWQGLLCKFLDPFPEELKMESTRQRWWGDF